MDMGNRIAVIGAGIAGASIAYHLGKKTDRQVIVFERESPASETTMKSVAQFGYYGDETQYRMKRYAMRLYNEFFQNPNTNPGYTFSGLLQMATTAKGAEELEQSVQGDDSDFVTYHGSSFDADSIEYVPGDELREMLLIPPVSTENIEGAIFRPKVGYMTRPQELAHEFIERSKEATVEYRTDTRVIDINVENNQVTGITIENDTNIDVDEIVCAAGPWNIKLTRSVGLEIPVKHTIAPVLKLEPPRPLEYSLPVLNHYESPLSFHRRKPNEFLISYNPGDSELTEYDPDTMNDNVPSDIRDEMIEALEKLVPSMLTADIVEEWVGIRSRTPDGNPIVGWTDIDGFNIAAFHTSGIQLAPMVGKIIAAQIIDGNPTKFHSDLSITRFEGYTERRD